MRADYGARIKTQIRFRPASARPRQETLGDCLSGGWLASWEVAFAPFAQTASRHASHRLVSTSF